MRVKPALLIVLSVLCVLRVVMSIRPLWLLSLLFGAALTHKKRWPGAMQGAQPRTQPELAEDRLQGRTKWGAALPCMANGLRYASEKGGPTSRDNA